MSELLEAVDAWFSLHEQHGTRHVRVPGVSDAELDEAEEAIGFEFVPEIRELYKYSNGSGHADPTQFAPPKFFA